MKRRSARILFALLAAAALAPALREDLAGLAMRQGEARLRSGELQAARQAFQRALALGRQDAPLRYNLGVTLYRLGEYDAARSQFDAAVAAAGPALLPGALFNRGNSRLRRAGQLEGHDRPAARALIEAAVADYRRVLALEPRAADARANLARAQAWLAALVADRPERPREPVAARSPAASPGRPAQTGARATQQNRPADRQAADGGLTGSGKPRRELSLAEVQRMLDEARGRARPLGLPHGGGHAGLAGPERDW